VTHSSRLPRIVLDWLRTVPAVSSCGQPDSRARAKEPTDGREAEYPVVSLELGAEVEPRRRIREPLPRHTSHNAPEWHRGETEEQREHASAPYELDRPNREAHGRSPQRVVEQLHKSTLPRFPAIQDRRRPPSRSAERVPSRRPVPSGSTGGDPHGGRVHHEVP
jgi:hypothetical protein